MPWPRGKVFATYRIAEDAGDRLVLQMTRLTRVLPGIVATILGTVLVAGVLCSPRHGSETFSRLAYLLFGVAWLLAAAHCFLYRGSVEFDGRERSITVRRE